MMQKRKKQKQVTKQIFVTKYIYKRIALKNKLKKLPFKAVMKNHMVRRFKFDLKFS